MVGLWWQVVQNRFKPWIYSYPLDECLTVEELNYKKRKEKKKEKKKGRKEIREGEGGLVWGLLPYVLKMFPTS